MKLIHVMADGSTRESVAGIVIKDKQFYTLLAEIQKKLHKRYENEKTA